MNETDKLKAEHARYKKALESIQETYGNAARQIARLALTPPPVTLAGILAVLRSFPASLGPNKEGYLSPSIEIFSDGSATIHLKMGITRSFTTVQQALDFLTTD